MPRSSSPLATSLSCRPRLLRGDCGEAELRRQIEATGLKKINGHLNKAFRVVDLIRSLFCFRLEEIGVVAQFSFIACLGENLVELSDLDPFCFY
jgi:hypothetical protein